MQETKTYVITLSGNSKIIDFHSFTENNAIFLHLRFFPTSADMNVASVFKVELSTDELMMLLLKFEIIDYYETI